MHLKVRVFQFIFLDNFAATSSILIASENQNENPNNDLQRADNGNLFNSRINFLSTIINDARVKLSEGGRNDMQTELEKKLLDNILEDLRSLRDFYEKMKEPQPRAKRINTGLLENINDFKDQQLAEYKRNVLSSMMSKTRRSHRKPLMVPNEENEFSPSISIGEFGT